MDVGQVAGVPQDHVAGRVEDAVQGQGELDDAEVRPEVAAALGDRTDHDVADLTGELVELRVGEPPEVGGGGDRVEQHQTVTVLPASRPRDPAGARPAVALLSRVARSCPLAPAAVQFRRDRGTRRGREGHRLGTALGGVPDRRPAPARPRAGRHRGRGRPGRPGLARGAGRAPVRTATAGRRRAAVPRAVGRAAAVGLSTLGLNALQLLVVGELRAARRRRHRRAVTIVFTDLEGFTRFTADHGDDAAIALLAEHHRSSGRSCAAAAARSSSASATG